MFASFVFGPFDGYPPVVGRHHRSSRACAGSVQGGLL